MGDVIEVLTTATNTVEVEAAGPQGIPGVGVPTGGSALQVLRKASGTDYDTEWSSSGGGSVDLSSPDPIGDVTPNTGAFTTLSATGTATLPHIHGSLAGNLYIHVKNLSGGQLPRGTPVYIVGNVGDTDRVEVAAADFDDATKMPAVGLLEQTLANNGSGDAIILGELDEANTNAYTINQELFVGNNGTLTATRPTTGQVQSVGVVARVNSNTGVIVVNMQGQRSPNEAFAAATHAASHATGGTDALAPSDIGAQSLFATGVITGASSPAAARAIIYDVMNFGSAYDINLPITNSLLGDVFVFRATNFMAAAVTIKYTNPPSSAVTVGTLTAVGEQLRFIRRSADWVIVPVDTHTHTGSQVTVGTTANLPLRTGTNGVIEASSFSNAAGTFCEGNDARLSDDRDPNLHAASHLPDGADEIFDQSLNTTDSPTFAGLTAESWQSASGQVLVQFDDNFFKVTNEDELSFEVQAGELRLRDFANNFKGTFLASSQLSADQTYSLPDASGVLALTDDLPTAASDIGAAASGSITTSGLTQSTARILGRTSSSTGAVEEIQIGSGLSLSAGELSATGSGVTSVTGTAPIVSSGGATPAISISAATTSAAGSMSSADKTKLDGIASGAEVNVNADWNASSGDAQILNKPTLGTAAAAATTDFAAASHTHLASTISDSTTAGRSLLTAADAAAQRTTLGLTASATTDTTNASNISSGTLAPARMGSGTPSASNFLRGDGSWQAVAGGVSGSTGSTDNSILRSDGTGGSTLQASALTISDYTASTQGNVAMQANVAGFSVTGVASTSVFTAVGHNFIANQMVRFTSLTGGSGVLTTRPYFVRDISGDTFKLSFSSGTGALSISTDLTAGTIVPSVAIVLQQQGFGGILTAIPDGGTTNGNFRGYGAIDLCSNRGSATAVASGSLSAVLGGENNTASNNQSAVVGGNLNTASGANSFVGGGVQCSASNATAATLGGNQATASGDSSVAIGGFQNQATSTNTFAYGRGALANRFSIMAHGNIPFAVVGDSQRIAAVLRCKTTTNAAVEMALDGSTTYLTIPSGKVIFCNIKVVGSSSDGATVATFERQYAAKNVAGTSSEVYAAVTIGTDNAASTSLEIATVDAGDYIRIRPTGLSATIFRWVASVDAVEVAYGT